MKNIIKRGTSLLLVLAMLLSFAAVVGAADERLPVEGEKPVTALCYGKAAQMYNTFRSD